MILKPKLSLHIAALPWICASSLLLAQDTAVTSSANTGEETSVGEVEGVEEKKNIPPADQAFIRTRKDARTMTLTIPGLRGQITDRFGEPFAQNIVVWYPALQMRQFKDESDEFIVKWSRERIEKINETFKLDIQIKDQELIEHYRNRRWIPMPFKYVVKHSRYKQLEGKLMDGVILHPLYQRYYPQKSCAAHIIGYTGSKNRHLEKGPINYGDPLFWELQGRAGLEKIYDKSLKGVDGYRKLQYSSDGTEVRREDIAPKPGGTVVTTIDMKWQKRAERVLRDHCKRGAFVIIDIETGEVLVMASRPSFDLNLWVPFIKPDDLKKLQNDKDNPLYARAFQGSYPPASTFKLIIALSALDNQVVTKYTKINCPAYIQLGRKKMYNWSRKAEGFMDVVRAIARSNNPFFIQLGIRTGAGKLMTTASQMGYGRKTGLPLIGETSGNLLTTEYTQRKYGRRVTDGDVANIAIGQGAMLASPLQVAQSMAGIANGGILPELSLVKQVQNHRGVIVMASKKKNQDQKPIDPMAVAAVQEGMYKVVNSTYGTGKKAALSYSVLNGKTGTAQWGPESKNQKLGWFSGFFPLDKPKYAFAVVYEGDPHEKVSGGSNGAPMLPAFFNGLKEEAITRHKPSTKALIVLEDDPEIEPTEPGKALIVEEPGKALIVEEPNAPLEPNSTDEPPKAILVPENEPETPSLDPNTPLPPPLDPTTPPEEPTEPAPPAAIPVDPAEPPKAIPVE